MKQDDVIRLAKKAGFAHGISCFAAVEEDIVAFAKLVAEHEREAIWNILFEYASRDDLTPEDESLLKHLADLIRARGQA